MHQKQNLEDILRIRLAPVLEVRFDKGGTENIVGYASMFGGPPDSYGDIIAPGAFKRTLAEHKAEGSNPLMLWSHKMAEPIGRWVDLKEDDRGLAVRGSLNLDTSRGKDAHAHLKHGDVSGLSIGWFPSANGIKANGDGTQTITDLDLVEISVVALPANRRARVQLGSKRELEDLLHKSGLPKAAAARLAAGGWPALIACQDIPQTAALAARIQKAADRLKGTP